MGDDTRWRPLAVLAETEVDAYTAADAVLPPPGAGVPAASLLGGGAGAGAAAGGGAGGGAAATGAPLRLFVYRLGALYHPAELLTLTEGMTLDDVRREAARLLLVPAAAATAAAAAGAGASAGAAASTVLPAPSAGAVIKPEQVNLYVVVDQKYGRVHSLSQLSANDSVVVSFRDEAALDDCACGAGPPLVHCARGGGEGVLTPSRGHSRRRRAGRPGAARGDGTLPGAAQERRSALRVLPTAHLSRWH
jgi:hypothetical protein